MQDRATGLRHGWLGLLLSSESILARLLLFEVINSLFLTRNLKPLTLVPIAVLIHLFSVGSLVCLFISHYYTDFILK